VVGALAASAAAPLVVLRMSGTAISAPACSYDGVSSVSVTLGPNDATTLAVAGGAIELDGSACGAATVDNTDTIDVVGSGSGNSFTIDLSGGSFTHSTGGDIAFMVDLGRAGSLHVHAGPGNDAVTLGEVGINLNAREASPDADVSISHVRLLTASGESGADRLSAGGGAGTGGAVRGVTLNGGRGDDTLLEGAGGDTMRGGAGTDTVDLSRTSGADADLEAGTVTVHGSTTTGISNVEAVAGSPGEDAITGDDGPNDLMGAQGDDEVFGLHQQDELRGGRGDDVLGGRGRDRLDGGPRKDRCRGGPGADSFRACETIGGRRQ
jgi:Ca2+-binding RTX toxin-like protein